MNPWFRSSLITASALCVAMAHGAALASDASERERINKAKSQADAKLAQKELECQERFAVTDCVLAARKEHRSVVEPLRKESLALDDKERKQRAAERTERLRTKAESASAAASANAAAASGSGSDAPSVRPKIRSAEAASASQSGASGVNMPAASSVMPPLILKTDKPITPKAQAPQPGSEDYQTLRVRQAEERRAAVLKKNAERDASKSPAKPLPVPGTAASGASAPG
jgi:colicin import membrane protein